MRKLARLAPRRALTIAAFAGLFVASFAVFTYVTFPYDRLRDYVEERLGEQPLRSYALDVHIDELSPSWLNGVHLEGVRVRAVPNDAEGQPILLRIDELNVHISLVRRLFGTLATSFAATIGSGTIEGSLAQNAESVDIELELNDVSLRELGVLDALAGLPVKGKVSGNAELEVPVDVKEAEGHVELNITGLQVGDGKAELAIEAMNGGFAVDAIEAGNLDAQVVIRKGVASIEKFQTNGADLKARGTGKITLAQPLAMSPFDVLLHLEIMDAYRNKSDRTKALFSLLDFNPVMRRAQTRDGALQYRLRGAIGSRMRVTPAGEQSFPN